MGDTTVTVDAGLPLLDGDWVFGTGVGALGQNVHGGVAVTAAAGGGVIGLELIPDRLGHAQLVGFVFLRSVEGADRLVIDVLHGADLGPEVGGWLIGNVAVGALCADPLHVLEVDAALILGERCLHGVAGDAKFGGAGLVQHCDCHSQCRDAQQGSEQQEPEPGLSQHFSKHGGSVLRIGYYQYSSSLETREVDLSHGLYFEMVQFMDLNFASCSFCEFKSKSNLEMSPGPH
ncbi:hypothetical protein D3C85_1065680 [compost metagenome]